MNFIKNYRIPFCFSRPSCADVSVPPAVPCRPQPSRMLAASSSRNPSRPTPAAGTLYIINTALTVAATYNYPSKCGNEVGSLKYTQISEVDLSLEVSWDCPRSFMVIQRGANITWSISLLNTHKRHPIACPWGRAMGCLLWVQSQVNVVLLSLWCYMCYHDIPYCAVKAPDCISFH